MDIEELQRQLAGCLEDNRRKTYAVQRTEIELQAAKDKIRELERELAKCREKTTGAGSGK